MKTHHVRSWTEPEAGLRARPQFAGWSALGSRPEYQWINRDWDVDGTTLSAAHADRGRP